MNNYEIWYCIGYVLSTIGLTLLCALTKTGFKVKDILIVVGFSFFWPIYLILILFIITCYFLFTLVGNIIKKISDKIHWNEFKETTLLKF